MDLEKQLNEFKLAHYKNADFDFLIEKTNQLYRKFGVTKDKRKQNRIVLEIYTVYLQAVEILFINAHALSVKLNSFPNALFIDSINLHKLIQDKFSSTTDLSSWFLQNYAFAIHKKKEGHKDLYVNLLKEVTKDYLDNLNLLNAYKHGYRVSAKHDKMILSLGIKDGKHYKLDESDSSITYFSKGKYDNNVAIFSNTINHALHNSPWVLARG